MQKKMKKADLMLTFFFFLILGLLFFIPSSLWASQFFKLSSKATDSFYKLKEIVGSIKDGEILSMPFYMDKKSFVVGFAKGSSRFENHEFVYDRQNPDKIVFVFDRLKNCDGLKACICLCSGVDLEQKNEPYSAVCNFEPKCTSFDNIDILSEKTVRRYGLGKPQNSWKGGFLHLRNVPAVANGLVQNQIEKRTFYIQRYRDIIDVCLDSPCMADEMKKQIELNEPIKTFNLFTDKYKQCKENNQCGAFNLKIPPTYYIYYKDSKNGQNGFYLVRGNYPKNFEEMDIIKKDGKDVFYEGALYKDENMEFPTGNIFQGYESELRFKDAKVILKVTTEFNILD